MFSIKNLFGFKYKNGFLVNKKLQMIADIDQAKIITYKDTNQIKKQLKRCDDNIKKWKRWKDICKTLLEEEGEK